MVVSTDCSNAPIYNFSQVTIQPGVYHFADRSCCTAVHSADIYNLQRRSPFTALSEKKRNAHSVAIIIMSRNQKRKMCSTICVILITFTIPPFSHCLHPAWCYHNQEEVGGAIAASLKEKHISREELFITTKVRYFFWHTTDIVTLPCEVTVHPSHRTHRAFSGVSGQNFAGVWHTVEP